MKSPFKVLFLCIGLMAVLVVGGCRPGKSVSPKTGLGFIEWTGRVSLDHDFVVRQGGLLYIKAGTVVDVYPPAAGSNYTEEEQATPLVDIIVYGRLLIKGTPSAPVVFRVVPSKDGTPATGKWGGIKFISSRETNMVEYANFSNAETALSCVYSVAEISQSIFTKNDTGINLSQSNAKLYHNTFQSNEIGLSYIDCASHVEYNLFEGNGTGVIYREPSRQNVDLAFRNNNLIDQTSYNFRLGKGVEEEIIAVSNWWGSTDLEKIEAKLYGANKDAALGLINYVPFLRGPIAPAGAQILR